MTFNNAFVKSGDINLVVVPASVAIDCGDLVYSVSGAAKPADQLAWSSLAANQESFHDNFLGSSLTTRTASDARTVIEVASTGEAYYPCDALAAQHEIGEYVGVAKQTSANALDNQKVAIVATANLAIGVLSRRALAGDTGMWFKLAGVLTTPYKGCQAFA